MKNNVYIRSNRSIMSITLTRMLLLLPLICYGIYKNGFFLYKEHLVNFFTMFKPMIMINGSIIIGILVNIIYEYLIKKSKDKLKDVIFSSFHVEYSLLIACVMSINVKFYIYFPLLFIILFISKFLNNRINIMALTFIIIYLVSYYLFGFNYPNIYEGSKVFTFGFMDYLIGRTPGGIASTHIIFLLLLFFGLAITSNNKTNISISAIISYVILIFILALIGNKDFAEILFSNNYLFIAILIATDSVTSCYTNKGMFIFGTLIGIISFILYFLNPILAPFIAILIISLFNNLIDRLTNDYANRK